MSLSFDVQNILVLLAGFTGIVYGLIIYSGNKKNQTNLCFLGFSYIFPEDKPFLKSWKNYLIFIPFIFIAAISLLPEALIKNVNIIPGKEKEIIFNKFNYSLYVLCINVYFGWNYIVLIKK